mmetsp:Transcript_17291/g.39028  ORF Transcript_17291/g.39028 Transcript_17291/m.39028 type:complete len:82 (-) Transcript_17291:246-491(-)
MVNIIMKRFFNADSYCRSSALYQRSLGLSGGEAWRRRERESGMWENDDEKEYGESSAKCKGCRPAGIKHSCPHVANTISIL